MNEREKKFKKLAENRVNNAIKQIRLVGNLANKSNYTYDEQQAKQIINTLSSEINELKIRFKLNMKEKTKEFKF
jgi:hypothetical protein